MRRVPGQHGRGIVQTLPVVVADHHGALRAAGAVLARAIFASRECTAVHGRAGQDVVPVGLVTASIDHLAFFGKRGLLGEVVGAVQFVDRLGDDHALGVHPRTLANAVARVHRPGALRRQIGVPGLAAGAHRLGKLLAMLVGTGQAAEIGALARTHAGHEETHIGLQRLRGRRTQ